jgi:hypothetical protein
MRFIFFCIFSPSVLYRLFCFSLGLVSPSDISELAFCFEAWFALVIAPRARVKMVLRSSTGISLNGYYPYGYYGNQGYGYGNGNQGYRHGNGNQGYRHANQRQEPKGQMRERSRRDQTGR